MSNVIDAGFEPLALVDSFYGPGAFAGWVLTTASIAINWAFNAGPLQKDKITVGLVIALAFPCVAAGHFIWIVSTTGEVDLYQYSGFSNPNGAATPASHVVAQYVAAAHAPFRVCQCFMPVYLCLFQIARWTGQKNRLGCAVVVGTFVYLAKLLILAGTGGERPSFFSGSNSTFIWVITEPIYLVAGVQEWSAIRARTSPPVTSERPTTTSRQPENDAKPLPRESDEGRGPQNQRKGFQLKALPSQVFRIMMNRDVGATLMITALVVIPSYLWTQDKRNDGFLNLTPLRGPVPRSPNHILEMAQFAALASGVLMLVLSIREAILSRRMAASRQLDVEAEGGAGRRRVSGGIQETERQSEPVDRIATGLKRSDTGNLVSQRRNKG